MKNWLKMILAAWGIAAIAATAIVLVKPAATDSQPGADQRQ